MQLRVSIGCALAMLACGGAEQSGAVNNQRPAELTQTSSELANDIEAPSLQETTLEPTPQPIEPVTSREPCSPANWNAAPKSKWLKKVAAAPPSSTSSEVKSRGGTGTLAPLIKHCSDDPRGDFAQEGANYADPQSDLEVIVSEVRELGPSKRDWPGVQCVVQIRDPNDARLHAELELPKLNNPTAIWRDESAVFVSVNFNGYAKEVGAGNQIIALDLCTHEEVWRSKDFTSNAGFILSDEAIYTAYGFTKEPDFVYVLDRGTGKTLEKHRVPTGPRELRQVGELLEFPLYDGVTRFKMLSLEGK